MTSTLFESPAATAACIAKRKTRISCSQTRVPCPLNLFSVRKPLPDGRGSVACHLSLLRSEPRPSGSGFPRLNRYSPLAGEGDDTWWFIGSRRVFMHPTNSTGRERSSKPAQWPLALIRLRACADRGEHGQ